MHFANLRYSEIECGSEISVLWRNTSSDWRKQWVERHGLVMSRRFEDSQSFRSRAKSSILKATTQAPPVPHFFFTFRFLIPSSTLSPSSSLQALYPLELKSSNYPFCTCSPACPTTDRTFPAHFPPPPTRSAQNPPLLLHLHYHTSISSRASLIPPSLPPHT